MGRRERIVYQVTAGIRADDDGHRVECSVPLPVAPAVVWDAVSTGEGMSSWFVPTAMESWVGGRVIQFADPGAPDPTTGPEAAAEAMLTATVGEITEYSPPTADTPGRFTYVERDWMGEGVPVPAWETSCEVSADEDGGSVLRLSSGFSVGGQLVEEAMSGSVDGWAQSLTVLAHRLTHRPADGVVTVAAATDPIAEPLPELWARVSGKMIAPASGVGGNGEYTAHQTVVARSGEVGGIVLATSEASMTLVLSGPSDGVVEIFAFPSGQTHEEATAGAALAVRVMEYVDAPGGTGEHIGAASVDVAPTWDAPRWREWLASLTRP